MDPSPHVEIPVSNIQNKHPCFEDNSKTDKNSNNNNNNFNAFNNKPNAQNDKNSISFNNGYNNDASSNTDKSKNDSKNVSIVQSEIDIKIQINIRSRFMLKVFGILLTQFIFTFGLILICQIKKIKNFLFTHTILLIISMGISGFVFLVSFIIFMCKPDTMRKVPQNYIVLFLITVCETVLLCYISILYSFIYVVGAISYVTAICIAIFGISLCNKIDMKFLGMSLIILIFIGLTYGLLALIFRSYYLNFLFCLIGAIIFELFIVYDTQLIRDQYDIDDYIFAALTLYFDIIRLFIQLLKILGSLSRERG